MRPFEPEALDHRDPELIAKVLPVLETVNHYYFHSSYEGLEHIDGGPAVFVSTEGDIAKGAAVCCVLGALWRVLTPESPLYLLVPDRATRKFERLGRLAQRFGAVVATRSNALCVLEGGGQVLVSPAGALDGPLRGRQRNEISSVARCAFVEVARRAKVPIVPIVATGARRGGRIFQDARGVAEKPARWMGVERSSSPSPRAPRWTVSRRRLHPYLLLSTCVRVRVLPPVTVPRAEPAPHVAARIRTRMQTALGEMLA